MTLLLLRRAICAPLRVKREESQKAYRFTPCAARRRCYLLERIMNDKLAKVAQALVASDKRTLSLVESTLFAAPTGRGEIDSMTA